MNRIITIAITLLIIFSASSQEPLSLTGAISEGLQNNRAMVNANYDVEIAKKRQWEVIATSYP